MAQTLAELLVKIKTEGADQVKRELRDIEDALRKANAASERNIKSFERTQARIIAGQKSLMTSGGKGGGGATSMGIDPKELDNITQALRQMSAPLNAVLDGFTQFAQVFAVGGVRMQNSITQMSDRLKEMKENTKDFTSGIAGSGLFDDLRRADPAEMFYDRKTNPLARIRTISDPRGVLEGELIARVNAHNQALDRLDEKERSILALEKRLNEQREKSLPIWERLNDSQKTGIVLLGAYVAILGSATNELIKFAVASSKAGVEYESMRARISGMDKKGSSTDQIFALARSVAGPTKFTTKQMEEASVSLLSYGVNVERTLPLIGKLGQAFGADQEKLNFRKIINKH